MNPPVRKIVRLFAALSVAGALSACAPPPDLPSRATGPDVASRDAAIDLTLPGAPGAAIDVRNARFTVTGVSVEVPQRLSVSEANLYYPVADIVWRGEPRGDRHAQVRALFEEAFARATRPMRQGPAATVEVEVTRFHALSEKTRYSIGGVQSIRYRLTVRDAETGAVLDGPREVVADYRASGGARAIEEESQGLTQRVVAVHNLALSAARALSEPAEPEAVEALTRRDGDLRLGLTAVSMKNERERFEPAR